MALDTEQMEARYALWRRRFEIPIIIAALAVVPVIILEQADTPTQVAIVTEVVNWLIWLAFAAELAVLTQFTPRGQHLRRHWLDIVIVVTSFPLLGTLLAGTRLFRLLRIARLLRLLAVATRGGVAIRSIFKKGGIGYLLTATLLMALVAGGLFTLFEPTGGSIIDGIWWAIVTLTTVGYGDLYPQTTAGRGAAIVLMLAGISFVAVLTGAIAAYLAESDEQDDNDSQLAEILERLDRIERSLDKERQRRGQSHH